MCHSGKRPDTPVFASGDPQKSYEFLSRYVRFNKIEESILVVRAGNGHCGLAICKDSSDMMAQVEKWWKDGENSCQRNGKFFSEELPVPPTLPSAESGFGTLSFDLAPNGPQFKGVKLLIDAQDYVKASDKSKGAYRFKSPRLVGGTSPIYLSDVKILLNGNYDFGYNPYQAIERTVYFQPDSTSTMGSISPVLSGQTSIVVKDGVPNPKLQISFSALEVTTGSAACYRGDVFKSEVMGAISTLNCATCHQSMANATGARAFDCSAGVEDLCKTATGLVDMKFKRASPLLVFPVKGLEGHPGLKPDELETYSTAITKWLEP